MKSPRNSAGPVVIIRPRLQLGATAAIGPGKIELLRAIGELQSISAAAKAMALTYKRAWLLVATLNQGLGRPVVETAKGGKGGGGASLTELGIQLVRRYDALEARINKAAGKELMALENLIK
ncbi:winged helix-turn-helix domain-containing protein [Sulfurisoma sediminicola]|uniref:Molybdate transport system regulatory protein n=1 Tax=Sulfurisoma sediminicola TaxID=1381557 RepID=A0A497XF30_9PROT|nr:LysR family transcriptional regulator [Sulfurisoma sediminicola]RLJ65324.1 molybdate transport system regulatory protein [Sulfurisoma sediminicola]